MKQLLLLIIALFSFSLGAQSITGKLKDKDGNGVEFAPVTLHSAKDSLLIKGEITDENGKFSFSHLTNGSYFIEASFIGLESLRSKEIQYSGTLLDLGNLSMNPSLETLNEVTIKAKKPLIEIMADKTVLNTDASISTTGLNGLELLRKAPGVTVDNNENISLRGKSGVRIQIDGKTSYLNAQELAGLLKGLSSSDIEAIEIITNPSAKYDAEGNAGIINLRLRKNKNFGMNGSLNASGGYGKYHKSYFGLNLNNRNKKVNTYGSFGVGNNKDWNEMFLYRQQDGSIFDQSQSQVSTGNPLNGKIGVDYYANSKHTFGILINANTQYKHNSWESVSETLISKDEVGSHVDSILSARNTITNKSLNANLNLNYRFSDTLGNEVTIDLDRGLFNLESSSMQPNSYIDATTGELRTQRDFSNETPSDINIYAAKIDYSKMHKPSGTKWTLGSKYANVNTNNTFNFNNIIDGLPVRDPYQSNNFDYTEEVIAGYLNVGGALTKKLNYQLGLRMEHTHTIGDLTRDEIVDPKPADYTDRNYTDLFPSGALTYSINDINSLNLTYSRRLDRPNYQDLNPFEWRLDELTFRKGNPMLTPQYNHNVELSYVLMQASSIGLSYTNSKDVVTDLIETDPLVPNKSFINYRNLSKQRQFSLNINSPLPIKSWWNGYLSANIYKTFYEARFPEYSFDVATPLAVNVYMEHGFTLPDDYSFEISGWFNSAAVWGGSFITKSMGSLDLGAKKTVLGGNGSIKIGLTDILGTAGWNGFSDAIPGLKIDTNGRWESQRVNVNFNYRFGNNNVKSAREHQTGLESEKKRIKN